MTNIVLLCRDRYRLTQQALTSLHDHTAPDSYNLTLVDDGSSDFRTQRLLRVTAEDSRVTLLELMNSGHVIAQMKNLGVAWSEQRFGRGDWLYLSDSDVYFRDGWLKKLTLAACATEPHGFRLFGGQLHPFHRPTEGVAILDHGTGVLGHMVIECQILDGPSWLMRWSTWDLCGPFKRDAAPGPCQSEEYPFCQKIVNDEDKKIGVIVPHVVVHTGLTQTNGKDAPGRAERELIIPKGVLAE